jgi:predicted transcriptional regulator
MIQSAISAALRELNVLILASDGMADLIIKKVNDNNNKNNRTIKCMKMKSYEA